MSGQDTVVLVDSRDRVSGTQEDFTYRLQPPLYYDSVFVKSVTLPRTFYNINSSNNQFAYTIGGVPQPTETLTPGNYTFTEIETWLNGIGPGAFSFNTNTQTFSMEWLIGSTVILYGSTATIGSVIGWTSDVGPGTVTDTITAPYTLTASLYPQNFLISSFSLRQSNSTPYYVMGKMSNCIQTIDTNHGGELDDTVIFQDFSASKRIFGAGSSTGFIQDIDIQLLDDRGNPVNLNDPLRGWQLELVFRKFKC